LTYKEKQIMEILSFILGIAFVVVIALAIVAVYALVKVNRVKKDLEHIEHSLSRETEQIYRNIHDEISNVNRRLLETEQNVFRVIDSRFDKLISKPKQLLKD